jgi:hypothetical protein
MAGSREMQTNFRTFIFIVVPLRSKLMYTVYSMEALGISEEIGTNTANVSPAPAATVFPGDILRYRDVDNRRTIHTIRIKDQISSAMKGVYYIVTNIIDEEQDDDSADQEVPSDVMEEWVDFRVDG